MILVDKCENCCHVFQNGNQIGEIILYENDFHISNCYLKFAFSIENKDDCKTLFSKIRNIAKKPLQVMISSKETAITETLLRGGFVIKRKCYETEAKKSDYLGKTVKSDLSCAVSGTKKYEICCRKMYEHYLEMHENINPWTSGYKEFYDELPKTVLFEESENEIVNLAFTEENEIAYVCGNTDTFTLFAEKLVSELFEKYETVCFESDNCDEIAMELKSLFRANDKPSFDTYVYE